MLVNVVSAATEIENALEVTFDVVKVVIPVLELLAATICESVGVNDDGKVAIIVNEAPELGRANVALSMPINPLLVDNNEPVYAITPVFVTAIPKV